MRIRARRSRRPVDRVTLNLASMIDVTFLLLIYFMVTMVLAKPEDRLNPTLQTRSESAVGPTADFQPQIVDVVRQEQAAVFRLGLEVYADKTSLTAALRRLYIPAGLFVRASGDVPVGAVAAAIQSGRDAGFEQVTYVPAQ